MSNDIYEVTRDEYAGFIGQLNKEMMDVEQYYEKNITIIDEFTNPYSRLEEMAVEDGMDLVDEILYSEEDEHVYRLLLCLEDKLGSINYQKELYTKLISFARYNDNKKIAKEIEKIIDLIKC